jgi:hypothetical protein
MPLPFGGRLFEKRKRGPVPARREVPEDWLAALPRDKSQAFDSIVRQWECSYAMMSVALDDSLSLRLRGEIVCARQQVRITANLVARFSGSLIAACDSIAAAGRHVSDLPVVRPLKSEFFRGDTAQSAASWNGLLHHVLFGDRSRFFHKLRILSNTVEQLDREFNQAAADLSEGIADQPGQCWTALDSAHYDLNTCLREAEVVLKAFLRALPSEQLATFAAVITNPVPAKAGVPGRERLTRASA